MRPRHWIILEAGQMPLNRVVKPDYLRAQEMARQEIAAVARPRRVGYGHAKGEQKGTRETDE